MPIAPIDYSIDVKSPFDSALSGFQTGMNIGTAINQQKQLELQRQQALQMQADEINNVPLIIDY